MGDGLPQRQYRVVWRLRRLAIFLGVMAAMGLQPSLSMLGVPVAGVLRPVRLVRHEDGDQRSARTANAAKGRSTTA